MESYLNNAPCLFFSCKTDGTLVDVNDTLCNHLGFAKEELVGKKVDEILTVASRIFQQTHFSPLLMMHGHAEEVFISLQSKSKNHVPVLLNAVRQLVGETEIFAYVGIVVYNRKKFEDELIQAKKLAEVSLQENVALAQVKSELQKRMEQLDQQMHLVAKQNTELLQFNRVVTHDLQEPLRKLSLFGNMLIDAKGSIDQKRLVERLVHFTQQMRAILSGLQQYVWLTENAANSIKLDLNQVAAGAKEQLEKEYPHVNLNIEGQLPKAINADPDQMNVLFYHIFSNVIRFRKDDNQAYAKIAASNLMLNQFQNLKEKYNYVKYVKIVVADAGIGFDSQYKEQVFELFKRLHPISGRGIGLSVSKKIIENHNGTIMIDSLKDVGTTITILLPTNLDSKEVM